MTDYQNCTLCPRRCGADRRTATGFCGVTDRCLVARAMVHMWEEPCISGTRGSGAVFFSGCNLRCAYCQNAVISHHPYGETLTETDLAYTFESLVRQGVHNLNLVTATPFIPTVEKALRTFRSPVPVVWNSSGYEDAESLKRLEGLVQIYLPDLKHKSTRLSALCAGAADYYSQACSALHEMKRQVGENRIDENGILQKGMIIRHLLLPGCTKDACDVLDTLAGQFTGVPVSLMRQYTPQKECTIPGLNRRVSEKEYRYVLNHYMELGLTGYVQEKESAQSVYTPIFDKSGIVHASSTVYKKPIPHHPCG